MFSLSINYTLLNDNNLYILCRWESVYTFIMRQDVNFGEETMTTANGPAFILNITSIFYNIQHASNLADGDRRMY